MMELTKERLQEIESVLSAGALGYSVERDEVLAMARQLLAGMEQDPVAYIAKYESGAIHGTCDRDDPVKMEWLKRGMVVSPLYAAPQLPQPAVQNMHHDAKCDLFRPRVVNGVFVPRHCDCSAAMLQGAEPAQEWIPCSEMTPPMIPDTSIEYLVYETLNNRVSHDYWNVPEGNRSCQAFWNHYSDSVTHWMPLPAAPQQEVDNG